MNLTVHSALLKLSRVFPSIHNVLARHAFNDAVGSKDGTLKSLGFSLTEMHLKRAGHKIEQDTPYIEVLKLKSGKEEFDQLKNT